MSTNGVGSTPVPCHSLAHTRTALLPFISVHYSLSFARSCIEMGFEEARQERGDFSAGGPTELQPANSSKSGEGERERERGDACTTVRAVNFMTLPSTGDKRRKRKKNGSARRTPRDQVRDSQSVLPFGDTSAPKTTAA